MKLQAETLSFSTFSDLRGHLTIADESILPFAVKRSFWIQSVPSNKERGGHAHTTCHEVIIPIRGSFKVDTYNGKQWQTYCLNTANQGLFIPAGLWCTLYDFSEDAICLVFASEEYQPCGYINDLKDYQRFCDHLTTL